MGQKNFWVQKINFWVKNTFGSKNFWVTKIFWVKKILVKKFWSKNIFIKKNAGRVNPTGRTHAPPPTQIIVGLKLCWVVVSCVRWGRIQNFRPLGPLFLVEVEFLVGWGGLGGINSNYHVKPNLTLRLRWVVVRLGFWQKSVALARMQY